MDTLNYLKIKMIPLVMKNASMTTDFSFREFSGHEQCFHDH